MSVVPPVLSCTETEQKWHKPRTMGVKPGPVNAMVVVKAKPGATATTGIRFICLSFCANISEQLHLHSLRVTWPQSRHIEVSTRVQSATPEWHLLRRERVTASHFREVCHVRGEKSAENLAERILRGTKQTVLMKRGLDMESGALKEYAAMKNLNLSQCGPVIHPDAPWLGASPDGLIYDPLERPKCGLVEMKCPNVQSYIDCGYLTVDQGQHKLKESHAYYWQVQGQLLVTE
ncbi:hypothetical protein WMY93_011270 [Mugilogobius chulae]|uniref:YqaJ viral recombinase domain-containing protein n=1 Tax=Mugilogobius chulae TaxID=88201 RepID=A0AAW0PC44_9GOBI